MFKKKRKERINYKKEVVYRGKGNRVEGTGIKARPICLYYRFDFGIHI